MQTQRIKWGMYVVESSLEEHKKGLMVLIEVVLLLFVCDE
jgi:hypothetical protein